MLLTRFLRIFTESFPKGVHRGKKKVSHAAHYAVGGKKRFQRNLGRLMFLYTLVLGVFLALFAYDMYTLFKSNQESRNREEKRLEYWENILSQHSNYTDAYFQAAVSAARLNKTEKALKYVGQALFLDPDFKEAEKLRSELLE